MPRPVKDLREVARRRLPRLLFDYIDGGSYDEATLRQNVVDMRALALRQRILRDTSHLSTRAELFGQPLSMPVALAPVGFAGMFARRGEVQAAHAAEAAGIPFCLSSLSICSLEEVAASCTRRIWFQLYMMRDRGLCEALLQRARAACSPVLLLTVDLPVAGARYRDLRSGMSGPPGFGGALMRAMQGVTHPRWLWNVQLRGGPHCFGNLPPESATGKGVGSFASWIAANFDPSVTWKDVEWVRARWDGPIILKGLLDVQDAREALSCGADAIVVSNHGGRQLDGALSSIRALPPIVDEVVDRIPVLIDGGIRSGLDVLRCLALGAKACLLGRAWAYALGAGGGAAVSEMLKTVHSELTVAMSLTGCTDVRHADRELIAPE